MAVTWSDGKPAGCLLTRVVMVFRTLARRLPRYSWVMDKEDVDHEADSRDVLSAFLVLIPAVLG